MSLLLDALKKAEQDKKKSSQAETEHREIAEPVIEDTDSMELELELGENHAAHAAVTDQTDEDFPEVDDTAIQSGSIPAEPPDVAEPIEEAAPEASSRIGQPGEDTDNDSSTDINLLEQDSESVIDASTAKIEAHDTTPQDVSSSATHQIYDETITTDTPPNESHDTDRNDDDNTTTATGHSDQSHQTDLTNIEKEQALSALIDKTNQHQRKHRLRRRILLLTIIILILFGSAIYYYLEVQTSSQDLYLTGNTSAQINRQPITQPRPEQPAPAQSAPAKQAAEATHSPLKSHTATPESTVAPVPENKPTTRTPDTSEQKQVLSIAYSKQPDPINSLLKDAYNAFHRQDYARSQQLYRRVLQREDRNRDALLGLAAIGIKQQNFASAQHYYKKLLQQDPRDSIAVAALSNLNALQSSQLDETQLKLLLKSQPDQAHLHFALGNLYARQHRWPEAQSAYFNAWSSDNKNADYSYNLAVSLDHINKPAQAIRFYKLSLQLYHASSAPFTDEAILKRIRNLEAFSQ